VNTYTVWYRKMQDGRAPDQPFLEVDYDFAGTSTAPNLKALAAKMATAGDDDQELDKQRRFGPGDVVQLGTEFWILVPQGVWARCDAILPA